MSESQSKPQQDNERLAKLYEKALAKLSTDKPVIFTNLLRFHKQAQYSIPPSSSLSSSLPSEPGSANDPKIEIDKSPCTGQEAYFTRYFPLYDQACVEVLGENDAKTKQKVLYKGKNLSLLKGSSSTMDVNKKNDDDNNDNNENKWDAVVMTRVANWDVVKQISESYVYVRLAREHRDAAVAEDVLWVSEAVDGFDW